MIISTTEHIPKKKNN